MQKYKHTEMQKYKTAEGAYIAHWAQPRNQLNQNYQT